MTKLDFGVLALQIMTCGNKRTGAPRLSAAQPAQIHSHRGDPDTVPVIAPPPEKLQDRCIAAPGLPFGRLRALSFSKRLARLFVDKDHNPLLRSLRSFAAILIAVFRFRIKEHVFVISLNRLK